MMAMRLDRGWASGVAVTLALATAVTPGSAAAHPGHGSKVVMGTLKEVRQDYIVVEAREPGAAEVKSVRIGLDRTARFRIDKERLATLDGMVGQRAIVSVDWEDDDRGQQILKATEVRFTRKK